MVNVYTEWGRLKEVIVGSSINYTNRADITFRLMYHSNLKTQDVNIRDDGTIEISEQLLEEREFDLQNLKKVLEGFGVNVHRPKIIEEIREFNTPYWSSTTRPADNIRDQVLIIGNEIIETSCMQRNRYFENDLLKDIFMDYFRKGAKWICSPRPMLLDRSFDFTYVNAEGKLYNIDNSQRDYEIIFDAAQCLKFGRDIIMNVSTENHVLGAVWLQRHLGDAFRVHQVRITDNHIDGMFIPLKPGTLLLNPTYMYKKMHLLPGELQKWDTLIVPEEDKSKYPEGTILLASSNISVNVLPIDETHVLVNHDQGELIKTLERNGFTPVPIKFRHARVFGGGIHCSTLDTIREDAPEDYFS